MSYEGDCCEQCKHFRRLKHNFARYSGFEESFCCVLFEYLEEPQKLDCEPWIQEVEKDSLCEMFTKK